MRLLVLFALTACVATAPEVRLTAAAAEEPAHPSAGCGAGETVVQGDRTLTSGGRTRRFRLVVPESARNRPAPLVLNLHGLIETAELQQYYSGMDAKAAARGMITVYPQGVGNSWNAGACCGRAQEEHVDDVRYLRDLVRELSSELCIDRARIYATGMSNGAIMSYRLACDASDLFAAIAPVAGVEAVPQCKPRRAMPVLAFHGTSDILVRWDGGWFGLESPRQTMARWRERNRCAKEESPAYQHGDTLCEAARGCDADVIFCRIDGGGHTWPGAIVMPYLGHTSSDVDATSTMLDFFLQHPLQRASGYRLQATGQAPGRSASATR